MPSQFSAILLQINMKRIISSQEFQLQLNIFQTFMCQWNWNAITKSTTIYANRCQLNISLYRHCPERSFKNWDKWSHLLWYTVIHHWESRDYFPLFYTSPLRTKVPNASGVEHFKANRTRNYHHKILRSSAWSTLPTAIVIMIQNATKCHEMPCNHQFERRYINPRVTYVEKPKRLQLNPSVNWLIYWVPDIYLRNQMEQVVLT